MEKVWQNYLKQQGLSKRTAYEVLSFGNSEEMANQLAELVLVGEKTATSSLVELAEQRQVPQAKVGDYYLLVDGSKKIRAIVETTKVEEIPFGEIDEVFALAEGDGSLLNWQQIHQLYYSQQLAAIQRELSPTTLLCCQWFTVKEII